MLQTQRKREQKQAEPRTFEQGLTLPSLECCREPRSRLDCTAQKKRA